MGADIVAGGVTSVAIFREDEPGSVPLSEPVSLLFEAGCVLFLSACVFAGPDVLRRRGEPDFCPVFFRELEGEVLLAVSVWDASAVSFAGEV